MTRNGRGLRIGLYALLMAALVAAAAGSCKRDRAPEAPPPEGSGDQLVPGKTNVLLVMIDTLRADHLGAYGYDEPTSPNLDELAGSGVVFDQAFANCSWTRPSIGSLLTGVYPRETGIYKERYDKLSPDVVTLAQMFKGAGYRTYGVTANPSINAVFGFDRGFDEYGDCGVVWGWMKGKTRYKKGKVLMEDADLVTDRSIALLERHASGPFYMQVLYIDPHLPYGAPDHFVHPLNDEPKSKVERYDSEVAFADAELGRLLAHVREHHPDTLILFTSDHGEGLDDHPGVPRAGTHGFVLYDSNIHVPLIFSHPGLKAGSRFPDAVQLLDLVPTLAELFGLTVDPQVKGTSLASVLTGGPAPELPRQFFLDTQFNEVDKVAIREPGFKLQINRDHVAYRAGERPDLDEEKRASVKTLIELGGPVELYRLPGKEHPLEKHDVNLADDPAHRETRERLEAALADWEARTTARPPINRDADKEVDSEVVKQLRALGYLE